MKGFFVTDIINKPVACATRRKDGRYLPSNRKHGCCYTPEYKTWEGIKKRCYNRNGKFYARYGGRGIKVCERWLHSFENFAADMGAKPSPEHQIDRINNDGDYAPENCRWATRTEQARNKANSVFVTIAGETMSLAAWYEKLGVGPGVFEGRARKNKTSAAAELVIAVNTGNFSSDPATPLDVVFAILSAIRNGDPGRAIARKFGVSPSTVRKIKNGQWKGKRNAQPLLARGRAEK